MDLVTDFYLDRMFPNIHLQRPGQLSVWFLILGSMLSSNSSPSPLGPHRNSHWFNVDRTVELDFELSLFFFFNLVLLLGLIPELHT